MIAAPASGSGKTVVTLGILAALKARGMDVRSAKSGPDYIDPAFHAAATGAPCLNLDAWAMTRERVRRLTVRQQGGDVLVVEAAMGLFDGAADGSGSVAELAVMLDMPVVLVVDAARQSQSIAALVQGFVGFRADVRVAGVILNRVGSPRHEAMLRAALEAIGVEVFGAVRRDARLAVPSRHLGLVQAGENDSLDALIEAGAEIVGQDVSLGRLLEMTSTGLEVSPTHPMPPPGQRIAVAQDVAFAFAYEHQLSDWRGAGADILPFSPLADEASDMAADAVFLPGGYPELHAGRLAGNLTFLEGLHAAAGRGAAIYGECGGFMVLGDALVDADGAHHAMAGLLPVTTSFAVRKLSLGYRRARLLGTNPFLGSPSDRSPDFATHEFHYTTIENAGAADPLFDMKDALGTPLGRCGMVRDNVCGSYLHVIDRFPA